ncbi:MAG TPA: SPOR domain-containing protein [Burkholderiales bacterium]
MAESEEALQLKRRARRRLVGAIALVTFVVIILPLILDKEPGPAGPPLSVQIPNQESGGFNTRVVPAAPAVPAAPVPEKKAEIPAIKTEPPPAKAATPAAATPEPAVAQEAAKVSAPAAAKTEEGRAQAAPHDPTWVVMLDAFSDAKNVKQLRAKLSAAGVKSYTEPVKTSKGELTRVRAGPFASKEAAEKAHAKLDAMGLKPGAVASR